MSDPNKLTTHKNIHNKITKMVKRTEVSMPRFNNADSSNSSGNASGKKSRQTKKNFLLDVSIYHFPGDTPLKSSYLIGELSLALSMKLDVNDMKGEKVIEKKICDVLMKQFPMAKAEQFKWEFFAKEKYKKNLLKMNFGKSTVFDGRSMRSISGDSKKLNLVLTKSFPGSLPRVDSSLRPLFSDTTKSGSDSDSDSPETPINNQKRPKRPKHNAQPMFSPLSDDSPPNSPPSINPSSESPGQGVLQPLN